MKRTSGGWNCGTGSVGKWLSRMGITAVAVSAALVSVGAQDRTVPERGEDSRHDSTSNAALKEAIERRHDVAERDDGTLDARSTAIRKKAIARRHHAGVTGRPTGESAPSEPDGPAGDRIVVFEWNTALKKAIARRHDVGRRRDGNGTLDTGSTAVGKESIARRHRSRAKQQPSQEIATADDLWTGLLSGNRRFAGNRMRHRRFSGFSTGIEERGPKVMVLACSDAAVSPELIFDKTPEELFVVRTAGNVADSIALGSVEYALEHLDVRLLVVLGHESCGAVTAVASDEPPATKNLRAVFDAISPALEDLRARAKGDELVSLGVCANVHRSAREIVSNSPMLQERLRDGKVAIVEAVYDSSTGEVRALPTDESSSVFAGGLATPVRRRDTP